MIKVNIEGVLHLDSGDVVTVDVLGSEEHNPNDVAEAHNKVVKAILSKDKES